MSLFRKRKASSAKPQPHVFGEGQGHGLSEKAAGKRRDRDVHEEATARRVQEAAPTLNVDIRNSLILPGLSQRFSVLLPSLSTAPETSLRSLLASQRARDGPSLTLAEEELLLAEIRNSSPRERRGRPSPRSEHRGYPNRINTSDSFMTTSASSPSLFNYLDASTPSPGASASPSSPYGPVSPLPTSSSFASFRTFGVNDDEQDDSVRTKSYGFSGGSSLRDGDYIRKVKKSASHRNLSGSVSSRRSNKSDDSQGTPTKENQQDPEPLPSLSERFKGTSFTRPESPSSERTATPTPVLSPRTRAGRSHSPSSSLTLNLPPQPPVPKTLPPPTPDSDPSPTVRLPRKRQSLLAGLSPAKMKRISAALEEIEGELKYRPSAAAEQNLGGLDEEEEMLDTDQNGRVRRVSNAKSEASSHSTSSTVFPYHVSPTSSHFTASVQPPTEPSSPSRLPPSPRSHNLLAQVAGDAPPLPRLTETILAARAERASPVPVPILQPSRPTPARHTPSLSNASSSSVMSAVPGYVPGQPRPVGSIYRSETGSRSNTPTNVFHSPASNPSSAATPSSPSIRARSGSSPQPIAPRTSSLARSQSVNQSPTFRPFAEKTRPEQTLVPRDPRLSSALAQHPPASTIDEADESEMEEIGSQSTGYDEVKIHQVPGRYSVANSRRDSEASVPRNQLGWELRDSLAATSQEGVIEGSANSHSGRESVEESVEESIESHGRGLSPARTLKRVDSSTSDFESAFEAGEEALRTPEAPQHELVALLHAWTGLSLHDMRTMQIRLVAKAKAEREALRAALEESPVLPYSPTMVSTQFARSLSPTQRALSPPPTAWRGQPRAQSPEPIKPQAPPTLDIFTPPPTGYTDTRGVALPVPESTPSERGEDVVQTPSTNHASRASSVRQKHAVDDAEVRRDFEARIAAATAALNRTPSTASNRGKLERKPTKRGAMVISSPTLVSSSAKMTTVPIESPETPGPSLSRAFDKMSGSAGKMSQRWKKLGFRKGPSISGELSPLPTAQPSPLDSAISLRNEPPKQSLDAFRFPQTSATSETPLEALPTPPGTANPTTGLRQMMDKLRRGNEEDERAGLHRSPSAPKPSTHSRQASRPLFEIREPEKQLPVAKHSPSSSDDSAVAKFIAAGRAVGLNTDQLNEMLSANGMLDRSASSMSQSTAPTSTSMNHSLPVSPNLARIPSVDKGPKGLFRSLSKRKKSQPNLSTPAEPEPRNVVVRRTLLMADPSGLPVTPVLNRSPNVNAGSPGQSPRGPLRKQSIKRKPVNLTREDRELVQNSPPAHQRSFSEGSVSIRSSGSTPGLAEAGGVGFLHPGMVPGNPNQSRQSSVSAQSEGSLYELYGEQEVLHPEPERRDSAQGNHAVEITEYEDGRVVWSIVDALRTDDADTDLYDYHRWSTHSRGTSLNSRRESDAETESSIPDVFGGTRWAGTQGLNPRQPETMAAGHRPETNVFFTSSADVADLIDHLSRDLGTSKGRIDIFPSSPRAEGFTSSSSPFPYSVAQSAEGGSTASASVSNGHAHLGVGQFDDAPSPRRGPPPPINLNKPGAAPAAGFSPKRQMFVRQQFHAAQSNTSPSAASFASSASAGRTVEERLQALLGRLNDSAVQQV